MVRTLWGLAWAISGLVFVGLGIYALVSLLLPIEMIPLVLGGWGGVLVVLIAFGTVALKFAIAWLDYKVGTYCWTRLRSETGRPPSS